MLPSPKKPGCFPREPRGSKNRASATFCHTLWTAKESVCGVLRHLVGSTLLEQPGETEAVLEAANLGGGILYSVCKSWLLGQEDNQLVPQCIESHRNMKTSIQLYIDMSPSVLPQANQSPLLCHSNNATSLTRSSLWLTLPSLLFSLKLLTFSNAWHCSFEVLLPLQSLLRVLRRSHPRGDHAHTSG